MPRVAAHLLPLVAAAALAACAKHPPNPLLGTWSSDHDLTVASLRREADPASPLDADAIERTVGPPSSFAFESSRVVFDLQGSAAMHFEYPYTVLSSDPQQATVRIDDPSGSSKTSTFHLEGPDLIWLDTPMPGASSGKSYRLYFRRKP